MNHLLPWSLAHTSARRTPLRRGLLGLALSLGSLCAAHAQVGLRSLTVDGLPVTLVYPTAQAAAPVRMGPFELNVALGAPLAEAPDAAPDTPAGKRRLVVLSHGTGGSPLADHTLAATLARAGFVVAQPLHQGDNAQDARDAGPTAWARRPQEVTRLLDALAADPEWSGRLALDRVGVHGMSAGGVTALSLAGAQWRTLDLVRHCLARMDADLGFCLNGVVAPQAQADRRASFERARNVDDRFLPAAVRQVHGGRTPAVPGDEVRPDPRVAAVTLAVPLSAIFSTESLARIAIPVGVVSAGRDTMLLPAFHSDRVLQHCGACQPLARLEGAAHMDLLSPWPESVARAVAAQHPRGGSPDVGFDPAARQAAFDAIAAFHRRVLGS